MTLVIQYLGKSRSHLHPHLINLFIPLPHILHQFTLISLKVVYRPYLTLNSYEFNFLSNLMQTSKPIAIENNNNKGRESKILTFRKENVTTVNKPQGVSSVSLGPQFAIEG